MAKRKQEWIHAHVSHDGKKLALEGKSSQRQDAEEIWLWLSKSDAAWLEAVLQAFRLSDAERVKKLNDEWFVE